MPDSSHPPGSHDARLTAEERQRLRPTVDSIALERFLASAPKLPRIAVIAHFATDVRLEDLLALQRIRYEAGEISGAELREYERVMREPWPDDRAIHSHQSPESRGLRFVPVPYSEYVVQLQSPSDPTLRALWDAIEPGP